MNYAAFQSLFVPKNKKNLYFIFSSATLSPRFDLGRTIENLEILRTHPAESIKWHSHSHILKGHSSEWRFHSHILKAFVSRDLHICFLVPFDIDLKFLHLMEPFLCFLNFVFVLNFLIFASQRSEFTLWEDLGFSPSPGLKGNESSRNSKYGAAKQSQ
jgi:hypothetical protein